jgi:5-methylthioadenosine/S-adenosylhomocysteine deaminase
MDRTLVRGGAIVTMDRNIGDLARGDILVEGDRIAAIGPEIEASNAKVVDAADMIVLPGGRPAFAALPRTGPSANT